MRTHLRQPAATTRAQHSRSRFLISRPMFPEGIISVGLVAALVTLAGRCVEDADWARITTPVALIALLSAFFGSFIARVRILDSLAHLMSLIFAFVVSFAMVAQSATTLEGGFRQR